MDINITSSVQHFSFCTKTNSRASCLWRHVNFIFSSHLYSHIQCSREWTQLSYICVLMGAQGGTTLVPRPFVAMQATIALFRKTGGQLQSNIKTSSLTIASCAERHCHNHFDCSFLNHANVGILHDRRTLCLTSCKPATEPAAKRLLPWTPSLAAEQITSIM